MDLDNQLKKLAKVLTPLDKPEKSNKSLGSLFTGTFFADFDKLSLQQQAFMVMSLKAEWELLRERYEHNSGPKGGRPLKWSDEEIEEVQLKVASIIKTPEYLNRKNRKNAEILAYEILAESLLNLPDAKEFLKKEGMLHSNNTPKRTEIKKVARGFKQRVRARTK